MKVKEEPKKWINKRYRRRAQKLLGKKFFMCECKQTEVDVLEILFELVDRVAFYAGDYWTQNGNKNFFNKHYKKKKISNPVGDLDGFEVCLFY